MESSILESPRFSLVFPARLTMVSLNRQQSSRPSDCGGAGSTSLGLGGGSSTVHNMTLVDNLWQLTSPTLLGWLVPDFSFDIPSGLTMELLRPPQILTAAA